MYYSVYKKPHRSLSDRLFIVLRIWPLIVILGIAGGAYGLFGRNNTREVPVNASSSAYYVSPSGSDSNDGKTPTSPYYSIQKAIDGAQPGDTINLSPGDYFQDIVTKSDGKPDSPITISGTADAVIKGGGKSRIFEVNHSNITLSGFTIDGLYGSPSTIGGYREKLLYVLGKGDKKGVEGLRILNMTMQHAKGECLRFRYFAHKNEVAYNTIRDCGVEDFVFAGGTKNGEGIYIGTAPEQLADGKNPTADPDNSSANWIHHNTISTQGNECVDIKEGSTDNIVEHNSCTGQKDSASAGFDIRGNNNTFRYNTVVQNVGAGFRIGGDTEMDGIHNFIYSNQVLNNQAGGFKLIRSPQRTICDNTVTGNVGGIMTGPFRKDYDPSAVCSGLQPETNAASETSQNNESPETDTANTTSSQYAPPEVDESTITPANP